MKKIIAGVVFVVLFTGCGPRSTGIVGTWTGTLSSPAIPGVTAAAIYPATETFRADGTVSLSGTSPFGLMESEGHYTLQGNVLSEMPTTGTINGRPSPFGPATAADRHTCTVSLSGDALTLTDKEWGTVFALRRVR